MNSEQKYINFTKNNLPFGWMGNMSPYPIEYRGKTWRTTEALFQAMRFDDEEIIEKIRAEKSPMTAKYVAKSYPEKMIIGQGSVEDFENMRLCILLKVQQHPELKKMLLDTGDLPIYEDVTSRGDKGNNLVWGAMLVDGEWKGQNIVGKIWMEVRELLRLSQTCDCQSSQSQSNP